MIPLFLASWDNSAASNHAVSGIALDHAGPRLRGRLWQSHPARRADPLEQFLDAVQHGLACLWFEQLAFLPCFVEWMCDSVS